MVAKFEGSCRFPCKRCGTTFWRTNRRDGKPLKKFCSKVCSEAFRGSDEAMLERFWAAVVKSDGCWEYQALNVEGYGIIAQGSREGRKQYLAHRFAWKVYNGTLPPEDLAVCHHCDNPRCVRPEHLFLGTWADNAQDKMKKGRGNICGEKNHHATLTDAQAAEIRQAFRRQSAHRCNAQELADKYGVARAVVLQVVNGSTYARTFAAHGGTNGGS